MPLVTRCPACSTKFKLVPDHIRVAAGWVRCGQCGEVFDSATHMLSYDEAKQHDAFLTEAEAAPQSARTVAHEPPPLPAPPDDFPPTQIQDPDDGYDGSPDEAADEVTDEAAVDSPAENQDDSPDEVPADSPEESTVGSPDEIPAAAPDADRDSEQTQSAAAAHGASHDGGHESLLPDADQVRARTQLLRQRMDALPVIDDVRPEPAAAKAPWPDEPAAPSAPEAAPAPAAAALQPAATPAEPEAEPEAPPPADEAVAGEYAEAEDEYEDGDEDDADDQNETQPHSRPRSQAEKSAPSFVTKSRRRARRRRSRAVRALLGMALPLLALALAWQAAISQRDWLAAREPHLAPVLQRLCQPSGCSVQPYRRLEDIKIVSTAFVRVDASSFSFSVTLSNTANMAIASPALELTLTDAQEQTLARRVVTAAELGAPPALAARDEFEGSYTLAIADASNPAAITGYRVRAFYP